MSINVITRKLYSGLILIAFLLFITFSTALLFEWNVLDIWLLTFWSAPLYLIYAPLWSIFSEFIGKKYARLPSNQKILSLLFHLFGGSIASVLISFYPRYIEVFQLDLSSLFLLIIYGCVFAFPFWITDSILLERTRGY